MHRCEHGLALDDGGHGALGHRSLMADHFRKPMRYLQFSLHMLYEIQMTLPIISKYFSAIPLPQHQPGASSRAGGAVARGRDH